MRALPAGVGEVLGAPLHGRSELAGAVRVRRERVPRVLDAERHVARLVHTGTTGDVGGDRIRG